MESDLRLHLMPVNQTNTVMKTQFMLMSAFLFASLGFQVQERTITGTVTSADDASPLPGVNVTLKGTATGTVTDAKGTYSIKVPASGGTLVFSFIGLRTQEIKVGSRSVVDVALSPDVTELSEVVVTGYAGRAYKKSKIAAE